MSHRYYFLNTEPTLEAVEQSQSCLSFALQGRGRLTMPCRRYLHPRSAEYIAGLAAVRGSQWGVNYAEGFEVVLRAY